MLSHGSPWLHGTMVPLAVRDLLYSVVCGDTAASCRARPVVSTMLTVTVDSCTHTMGTGAVRMRWWSRQREGADAEWEPRCGSGRMR